MKKRGEKQKMEESSNNELISASATIKALLGNSQYLTNLSEKDLESLNEVLNLIRTYTVMMITKEQINPRIKDEAEKASFENSYISLELMNRYNQIGHKLTRLANDSIVTLKNKKKEIKTQPIPKKIKDEMLQGIDNQITLIHHLEKATFSGKEIPRVYTEDLKELEQMAHNYRIAFDRYKAYEKEQFKPTQTLLRKDAKKLIEALLDDPFSENEINTNWQNLIELCARSLCDKDINILGALFTRVDNDTFKGCTPDPEKIAAFLEIIRDEELTDELIRYMQVLEVYEADKDKETQINQSLQELSELDNYFVPVSEVQHQENEEATSEEQTQRTKTPIDCIAEALTCMKGLYSNLNSATTDLESAIARNQIGKMYEKYFGNKDGIVPKCITEKDFYRIIALFDESNSYVMRDSFNADKR